MPVHRFPGRAVPLRELRAACRVGRLSTNRPAFAQRAWATLAAFAILTSCPAFASGAPRKTTPPNDATPRELAVRGHARALYYPPAKGSSRRVLLWLHGRGAHVADECAKWAPLARKFGWLLCPQGDEIREGGTRGWANDSVHGRDNVASALAALRKKSKNAIEPGRHVLIGFSEGAFIAMQLGVHETSTWSRWLILAANDGYWLGDGASRLREQKKQLRRVVLLTGAGDEVVQETRRTFAILEREKVAAKLLVPGDLGHEVPGERMFALYNYPLRWLLGLENDPPPKGHRKTRR